MSIIRSKDTKPEMLVRSMVHRLGYRFRLHKADLPGKPDLVFASRKKIIFIHGCYWHGHEKCRKGQLPKSNLEYWQPKIEGNKKRDKKNYKILKAADWKILTIWQCELKKLETVKKRIVKFLEAE